MGGLTGEIEYHPHPITAGRTTHPVDHTALDVDAKLGIHRAGVVQIKDQPLGAVEGEGFIGDRGAQLHFESSIAGAVGEAQRHHRGGLGVGKADEGGQ